LITYIYTAAAYWPSIVTTDERIVLEPLNFRRRDVRRWRHGTIQSPRCARCHHGVRWFHGKPQQAERRPYRYIQAQYILCKKQLFVYATADEAVAYMFTDVFVFFLFFFVFFRPQKIWNNRSRDRLNGFSWNFHQTIGGGNVVWNVVPPLGESRAAAWRMANVDALRNLRYDSFAITRGRHRRLRYTTMSGRIDVICFVFFPSTKNMRQPFSGTAERIFMKLLPNDRGDVVWNVVPPLGESRAAAWRMLIFAIYAMTLAESPEGATQDGCVIQPWAGEWM